ncbi:MAG: cell wall hydrolase [Smithella sp.]
MRKDLKLIYNANLRDFGHLPDDEIMAITLWAETRGEPRDGKIAVASVIIERVNHRDWDGHTVQEVCLWPKQFSCFNPDDPQRPKLVNMAQNFGASILVDVQFEICYEIASGILGNTIPRDPDIVRWHCCQYLNPVTAAKTRAKWLAAGMKSLKVVGNHEFFIGI